MYDRIPYLNNSLSSWAIHRSDLRCLVYYIRVCSGVPTSAPLQKRVDNKSRGTTLASARALYLDLLLHVWLCILGGRNCRQEFRRGVVYIDRSGDGY